MRIQILLSCEHGGNKIPAAYASYFKSSTAQKLLQSHRGYDAGALPIAQFLSRQLKAPLFYCVYSRLLIDLNRSLKHPHLFSEISQKLSAEQKQELIAKYYLTHRQRIQDWCRQQALPTTLIIHLAIHSFTPVLLGQKRNNMLGILYDPRRLAEKKLAQKLSVAIQQKMPLSQWQLPQQITQIVRKNYPYLGSSDGLCTHLRKQFSPQNYIGIELEINQVMGSFSAAQLLNFKQLLAAVIQKAIR